MSIEKRHSPIALGCMQIFSGGTAGLVEILLMHPLDVVKTRLQIQSNHNETGRYKSLGDCFKTMLRSEGIGSFYKGILPPIIAETPKRATKFFTFTQYKQIFAMGNPEPAPLGYALAGLCSGFTEALVVNPFEVVKIRLQSDRQLLSRQASTWQTAREIMRTGGYGFQESGGDLVGRFLLGSAAGFAASVVNIPFDVAKSRIQGPVEANGVRKYKSLFQTMALVYKEEGYLALYKGLLPKLMRLAPGGGVMLIVFETVYEFLQRTF